MFVLLFFIWNEHVFCCLFTFKGWSFLFHCHCSEWLGGVLDVSLAAKKYHNEHRHPKTVRIYDLLTTTTVGWWSSNLLCSWNKLCHVEGSKSKYLQWITVAFYYFKAINFGVPKDPLEGKEVYPCINIGVGTTSCYQILNYEHKE